MSDKARPKAQIINVKGYDCEVANEWHMRDARSGIAKEYQGSAKKHIVRKPIRDE
jgi:hypothetical protein